MTELRPRPTIVIVGGGASGTLAAVRLVGHPSPLPRRVVVIDPAPVVGRARRTARSTTTTS